MVKKILLTIDRSFDAGNRENFILNEILLVVSIGLLFVAALTALHNIGALFLFPETRHILHTIEVVFGIFFLIELSLRTMYVYIPDKKMFTLYPWVNILVIITLFLPHMFNFAFLRLIWIVKMFKIYHLNRAAQKNVIKNPQFIKAKFSSTHS